jgi:hypothetical protein
MHFLRPCSHETQPVSVPEGWEFMIQSPSPDWIITISAQRSLRLRGKPGFIRGAYRSKKLMKSTRFYRNPV